LQKGPLPKEENSGGKGSKKKPGVTSQRILINAKVRAYLKERVSGPQGAYQSRPRRDQMRRFWLLKGGYGKLMLKKMWEENNLSYSGGNGGGPKTVLDPFRLSKVWKTILTLKKTGHRKPREKKGAHTTTR